MKMPGNLALDYRSQTLAANLAAPISCLLVEDSGFDRKRIKRLISKSDMRLDLIEAQTIADARVIMSRQKVELVILDNRLPDGLGLVLTREIRNIEKLAGIPVIMLSGEDEGSTADAAAQAGCFQFMAKDKLDTPTLEKAIRQALKHREALASEAISLDADQLEDVLRAYKSNVFIDLNAPVLRLTRLSRKLQTQIRSGDSDAQAVTAAEIEAVSSDLHKKLDAIIASSAVPPLR